MGDTWAGQIVVDIYTHIYTFTMTEAKAVKAPNAKKVAKPRSPKLRSPRPKIPKLPRSLLPR